LYLLGTNSFGGALFFFFAFLACVFLVAVVVALAFFFLESLLALSLCFLAVRPAR
jgi:hypothetical protein